MKITQKAGIAPRKGRTGNIVAGVKFHNTRNTAATRMIEAGLSEVDAMNRGGWKTRSICEHYHVMQRGLNRTQHERWKPGS